MYNQELFNKAIEVRSKFESNAIPYDELAEAWLEYKPSTTDIGSFITHAMMIFPRNNCTLASVYLRKCLGIGDIQKGFYNQYRHAVLGVSTALDYNSLIIDITADQFEGPRVYVGPLISPWS